MEERYTFLKGTDKEIIAKDSYDNILTIPFSRLDEIIDSVTKVDVNKHSSIVGNTLALKMTDSEMILLKEKYYNIHAEFKDQLPWIQISGMGYKLNSMSCYAVSLKSPGEHGPMTGYISSNFIIGKEPQDPQFCAIYELGTKVIQKILKNKIIRDEIREFMAEDAMQNSILNITDKRLLRTIGRIFI